MSDFKRFPTGRRLFEYIIFFLIPLLSFITIEYAARGSISGIITWPINEPIQFLLSLALFYALYIFFWENITHRGATALSFSIIWIIIAAVVGCKREILGFPLMPWDLSNTTDVAGLLKDIDITQYNFLFNWVLLLLLAINIIIIIFIFRSKFKVVRISILPTVISFAVIVAFIFITPKADMADTASICEKDGYVRGFIVCAHIWSQMNDNHIATASATDNDLQYEFASKKATTDIKPNIIFIMSEAFWDATLLPNVTFSEDPIPNLHALAKEGISGYMVSPTYGDVTCNVEFEIMTGFSLKYLPYQTNAYTTSIKKEIPSLPSYFKSIGYQTIAVHPYQNTFFSRNIVYPLMGIDRFITEPDMPDAKRKGSYISDDYFADRIISEYEKAQKPVFMYNISMQNHWPYTTENYYDNYDIKVASSKNLHKDSLIALQNYAQGIHDADVSLKKIVDYFKTVKEPTVIVFLGDHLPALTDNLGVYKDLGYIDSSISDSDLFKGGTSISDETIMVQSQKVLETSYLIWFNYQTDLEEGKTISANYLGIYTMSKMGIKIPPFYNFLLEYSIKVPVNRYFLSVDVSGKLYNKTPGYYNIYEYVYQTVQNDILYGNQNNKDLFR